RWRISSRIVRTSSRGRSLGSVSGRSSRVSPGMCGHSSPQPMVIRMVASRASASVSFWGRLWVRSRPTSFITSTTTGCTRSPGCVPAEMARAAFRGGELVEECGGHLGSAGVVDAGEDHDIHSGAAAGCGTLGLTLVLGAADAGFWQGQLDSTGAGFVTGQGADDGADLFVAGAQQERGGAAVAFHADDEEMGLGVLELLRAVGRDGAAAVDVGIDQRREGARAFDDGVEDEAQLTGDVDVGAEAGGGDDDVDGGEV